MKIFPNYPGELLNKWRLIDSAGNQLAALLLNTNNNFYIPFFFGH